MKHMAVNKERPSIRMWSNTALHAHNARLILAVPQSKFAGARKGFLGRISAEKEQKSPPTKKQLMVFKE